MPVFYLCGDVYKFTRDHATLKFYKASHVLKTTKDYMKYSSKMAENRVCEIFNSVLKNKLNKLTKLFSPQLTTAFELHSESLFQFNNSVFLHCVRQKQPVVRKDINLRVLVSTAVMVRSFGFNPLQTMFRNTFKDKPYFKGSY